MVASVESLSPFTLENEGGARLGAGAAATVYRARDAEGRNVALKVMDRDLASDAVAARAFVAQATAMAKVRGPGLVQIHDAGYLDDGRPYVSMEILGGRSLAEVVARERVLGPARAVGIGLQIAAALEALHAQGTLHGDLHPGNVQVLVGDRVCLLDAGGAHAASSAPGGVLFGSAEYLAPELVAGAPRTPAADVYAAGVILYETLVGKTPFASHSVTDVIDQQLHVEPATVRAPAGLTPVPRALEAVVLRCLKKDPAARYRDGAALKQALAVIREALTSTGSAATVPVVRRPWARPAMLAAMAAGLLAASIGVVRTATPPAATPTPLHASGPTAGAQTEVPHSVEPEIVAIDISSEPSGASVLGGGGAVLGTTPTRVELPVSTTALRLELRFPRGEVAQVDVIPDRSSRVHAQSPELHRYVTAPAGHGEGSRP